ncbi:SDR family NAD(P)-dependent oxidoreductase [Frondihabitans australicus]|uniref:Short subunit dehydrogenase n=1 Tax=Frondihabitans australicus TaxID=386892 RepID=A0A495IE31_9MICO|nr:SDR family NAD(P)-dependent oxidoreductase [Frondihabitans australicus]RKR73385.1 short subunit dehydrogenase [Frondihabitans australicus]
MTPTDPAAPGTAGTAGGSAWVITGPTSGIGHRTALELAKHGTVVLVGRSPAKLAAVEAEIREAGGSAVSVTGDLADIPSARRAAREVAALGLPIGGVLNNAGIMSMKPFSSPQGFDGTYATDHLGPFAFTEALLPQLADGTHVVFIVSAVEDPERVPAVRAGFRGSRFISVEASSRGEWLTDGGSRLPGADAYATSKQGNLATALAFAREYPRLRFSAIEPGVNPGSNLSRDASPALLRLSKMLAPALTLLPHFTTPKRAGRVIAGILTGAGATGTYYDENARPMRGSHQVMDPAFQDDYVRQTRELLATVPDAA